MKRRWRNALLLGACTVALFGAGAAAANAAVSQSQATHYSVGGIGYDGYGVGLTSGWPYGAGGQLFTSSGVVPAGYMCMQGQRFLAGSLSGQSTTVCNTEASAAHFVYYEFPPYTGSTFQGRGVGTIYNPSTGATPAFATLLSPPLAP